MTRDLIFFLFRHGETDWNRQTRFQGHADIPLNETGKSQALALVPVLSECRLKAIVASDLARAADTARIVNQELGLPLAFDAGLREIDVGKFSGKTRDEIRELLGAEFWDAWASIAPANLDLAMPGGESKRAQLERNRNALLACSETFGDQVQRIGVCTHGGVIRRLVHSLAGAAGGADMQHSVPLPNCCVYRVDLVSGEWFFRGRVDDAAASSPLEKTVFE